MPCPPFWPCNKVLKPNFQSIISQTNNGCSLFSLILAELLLLDISCKNILALFIVTALTAHPFPIKKCAGVSVFWCENRKNLLADPLSLRRLGSSPPDPDCGPSFANPKCAIGK